MIYPIKCCTEVEAYDRGKPFVFHVGPDVVTNIKYGSLCLEIFSIGILVFW